jgi:hypothetical protein
MLTETHLVQVLRHLSGLATTCLTDHNKDPVIPNSLNENISQLEDWKTLSLISDRQGGTGWLARGLGQGIFLPFGQFKLIWGFK